MKAFVAFSIQRLVIPFVHTYFCLDFIFNRGVAQSGSALHWGCSGRGFKSRRPDQLFIPYSDTAILSS